MKSLVMISAHMFQSGFQKIQPTQPGKPLVSWLINLNGFIQMKLYADYVTKSKEVGVKCHQETYNLYCGCNYMNKLDTL